MGAKRGGGADEIYQTHLFGAEAKYNPSQARSEAQIGRMLTRTLTDMCTNRFKWDGLPESIDPRFLEMCLFYTGLCVVYWDRDYDKMLAVRGSGTGYVNMLDNPVSFTVIGPGSVVKPVTDTAPAQFHNKILSAFQPVMEYTDEEAKAKAFPIWANYTRVPDTDIVNIYAKRLATIDRTLEINTKNARRNKILKSTQAQQLSVVNFSRQQDEGVEAIQVTGPLEDMDFIEAVDLGVTPDSYEKLSILRARWWNECMNLLGVDGANQDKKERLVAAEVSANDGQTDSMRFMNLNARQEAAERINKVFGTNISVDYRVEVEAEEEAERIMVDAMAESEANEKTGKENDNS